MAGYIGTKAAVVTPGAERKKVFSITTTTTSLTGLAYTPGFVHVFHNGVRLVDGTDYTATNGTSLTLTTAAQNGDEVVVISYATFEVADAYTKAESDAEFLNQAEGDARYVNVTGDTMTNLVINAQLNGGGIGLDIDATTRTFGEQIARIRGGGAASNGTVWSVDSSGRVTMPYQPAFRAIVNNEAYLTTSPVPFGTTTLNVGNHFNTGTYTFTAPIAGVYFIFVGMYLKTDNNQDAYPSLLINGVSVQYSYLYNLGNGGRIDNTVVVARIISLSASDTVSVVFLGSGEYYGGYRETYFSGYLLG
jgi:hypothetical protein